MDCDKMTREELIARFASDWGFGPNVTQYFTTEELRKACKSSSPYNHMKMLIHWLFEEQNKNEDKDE